MPFYFSSALIRWKARGFWRLCWRRGDFGHNWDVIYQKKYPYVIKKAISLWRHTWDVLRQLLVFPMDALRAWGVMIKEGSAAVGR